MITILRTVLAGIFFLSKRKCNKIKVCENAKWSKKVYNYTFNINRKAL